MLSRLGSDSIFFLSCWARGQDDTARFIREVHTFGFCSIGFWAHDGFALGCTVCVYFLVEVWA